MINVCFYKNTFQLIFASGRNGAVGTLPSHLDGIQLGASRCDALWSGDSCGRAPSRPTEATTAMNSVSIFWMQILTSVLVLGIVALWYVWPSITKLSRNSALTLLLFVHVPRYVGMTLLVTDMIDPKLPREFLSSAAYGDLLEAALAFASIFALRKNWSVAVPLVWVANTWGFLDLLNGLRSVLQLNVPSFNLATLWYVYTFYAPLVLVSHVMIFLILIKSKSWKE